MLHHDSLNTMSYLESHAENSIILEILIQTAQII